MQDLLALDMQDLLQKQNDCSSGGMMKAIFQGKETPTLDNQQLPPALSGTFVSNCFIGFLKKVKVCHNPRKYKSQSKPCQEKYNPSSQSLPCQGVNFAKLASADYGGKINNCH